MTFLEAVIEISKRQDCELCDDEDELLGLHGSICVYRKDGEFIGKLIWPDREASEPAWVDRQLQEFLSEPDRSRKNP